MADDNIIPLNAWRGNLTSTSRGLKKSMTNLMLFLKNLPEFGPKLRWNELSQMVEWDGSSLEEHQLVDIRVILEKNDFEPNTADLLPAIIRHAREHAYHPVRDYLESLSWDGRKRLDRWLNVCMGAEQNPFTAAAGRRTLIAAVARIFQPGCKVDTVLILEGPQGIRKSSAIAALFGPELTLESVNLFDNYERMVDNMMGKWVVELAEFVAALRGDSMKVKGIISMQIDRTRLAYAKKSTDHPRSVIFIGTYNPDGDGYFTDETGNRRFWPVQVTKADVSVINSTRDQIWAEAVAAYQAGEQWWLTDEEEELAKASVAARESRDIWEEILYEKLVCTGHTVTTVSAALRLLGMPDDRMKKPDRNRMASVLRNLGYVQDENPTKDKDRKSVRLFRRKI